MADMCGMVAARTRVGRAPRALKVNISNALTAARYGESDDGGYETCAGNLSVDGIGDDATQGPLVRIGDGVVASSGSEGVASARGAGGQVSLMNG